MTDLSFPHSHSVNNSISPSLCSLHYCELDEAVHIVLNLGRGARMRKVDLKSAYRVIPIHPDDTPFIGIKWNSNVLLDKALPFGLRSAPKIFSAFANALAWVALQLGVDTQIHYLDDFFIAGPLGSPLCDQSYHQFRECCQILGIPVVTDKLVPPATTLVFLGIEVDSHNLQLHLPPEKLCRIQTLISSWKTVMQETGDTIPTGTFESRIKSTKTWPVFPTPDDRSFTHCYTPRPFYSPKCSISS